MAFDWREVYLVGTEWYLFEAIEHGDSVRHEIYHKVLNRRPPWDFGDIIGGVLQHAQDGLKAYLWGGTEGQCLTDPATGALLPDPVMVPVVFALVTSQGPPEVFGVQRKGGKSSSSGAGAAEAAGEEQEEEEFVPLSELGCEWHELSQTPEQKATKHVEMRYLQCKHAKDSSELERMTQESLARFAYSSLYLEPEKVYPTRSVDEDDNDNILTVIYSMGSSGAAQIEFDLRKDTVERVVRRTLREEELDESHAAQIRQALEGPIARAQKRK
eukprot:RCo029109